MDRELWGLDSGMCDNTGKSAPGAVQPTSPCLCRVLQLGRIEYDVAYSIQEKILEKRIRKEIPDTLILLEHEPVFTIGRSGKPDNVLITEEIRSKENIALFNVDRGGDVTYHGPGQIVGYPIFDLNGHGKDVHRFLRSLEDVIIDVLSGYGLEASRVSGFTGVWVGRSKIASIGIGVRKWVSFHGFSLNVAPDMRHFSFINPCGLGDVRMTSMKELLGYGVPVEGVRQKIIDSFGKIFRMECQLSEVNHGVLTEGI